MPATKRDAPPDPRDDDDNLTAGERALVEAFAAIVLREIRADLMSDDDGEKT